MAAKLQDRTLISPSSSNSWISQKPIRTHFSCKNVVNLNYLITNWKYSRKRCCLRVAILEKNSYSLNYVSMGTRRGCLKLQNTRRLGQPYPLASSNDGVTVNGSPQASVSSDVEEIRVILDRSLDGEDYNNGLVQSLHDAARICELAIKERSSQSKISWITTAWLGVDRNSWVRTLSYQASVYCLLQAASEISSRGDNRDRDVNVFVQRSLLRQFAPLESTIRDKLSTKQAEIYDWFWSEQVPAVVKSFVNHFEGDSLFTAATTASRKRSQSRSGNTSDICLLMLALTCIAAITKLGPAKVSCSQFFSMIPEITGPLMDMLVDFLPIQRAYDSIKKVGLHREFLSHFGPRAASCRVRTDRDAEEVVFWVNLVQKQLQQAIDRERIWSRLTTSESIEVLERDLAIFGFFIALGRRSQVFLCANGFDDIGDSLESFIRYLIGGSVLFYPQLSAISSYQLYVEVVCEELDWLPFYPGLAGNQKLSHGHQSKQENPPNPEAIGLVLDVCFHWMQSFIKYSKWLENPSNVKAAGFVSRGHNNLVECMDKLGMLKKEARNSNLRNSCMTEPSKYLGTPKESDSFDKALESVEEALLRLEQLLPELHMSSSTPGKEQLKAACSDLEKIRKLKKEAEFLEASFRAKAASLQQADNNNQSQSSNLGQRQYSKGKSRENGGSIPERSKSSALGFWSLLTRPPARKLGPKLLRANTSDKEDEKVQEIAPNMGMDENETSEIRRFELLRNELIELEKRVQKTADKSDIDEDVQLSDAGFEGDGDDAESALIEVQKKENIIEKSFDKLKETSRDVLQGTQLLAIDVAAAMGLLRRVMIGDELTEKEKKVLKRTLTDLASVVPIGVLMLLPVTAVGHAAMLAAIQRYVPSLIPSTYGPERLDLLRQLEKVKDMETTDVNTPENVEEMA
ncbi:uncharacterized protein LOC115753863 isoform X2 [Rhodamnia argentea]|uniref:Uncharacterized protein LOC115753863 isoform X2 n=1 Tax=Rhodamnia argentea TaxID=178133 RepID=A0A8B8QNC4_9MYRT|nr:uncharacterized protein LOC115753863 isoform X2 [Rhodamnia argentea]